jgi:hypothetical protein
LRRFLTLNDPFGDQNKQFNEMASLHVQNGPIFPDVFGMIKVKFQRLKGKDKGLKDKEKR